MGSGSQLDGMTVTGCPPVEGAAGARPESMYGTGAVEPSSSVNARNG